LCGAKAERHSRPDALLSLALLCTVTRSIGPHPAPPPPSQVMLRSRALEITVEGCLTSPLPAEHVPELQKLLATFLPATPAAAASLVAGIVQLSKLLADDAQSYDTLGAAQRAAYTLVGSLKAEAGAAGKGAAAAKAAAAPADKLGAIDREMAKEQGFLSKVSQGGVTK